MPRADTCIDIVGGGGILLGFMVSQVIASRLNLEQVLGGCAVSQTESCTLKRYGIKNHPRTLKNSECDKVVATSEVRCDERHLKDHTRSTVVAPHHSIVSRRSLQLKRPT